jgi:putative protease
MNGVCSPASHVEYRDDGVILDARLGGYTIHRVGKDESAPYPTLCKGCFSTGQKQGHLFEDPVSLNAEQLIPQLQMAGVTALKIEGRQRSRSYVAQVVRNFRAAVDALEAGKPMPEGMLARLSEGRATTTGAYKKTWR